MDDISKFERSEDISSMNSSNKKDLQVFIKVDDIERKALAMIQSFQQTKHVAELDQAQDMLRLVLEHRPPGHPTRDNALGNLGNVLHMRYEFTKNLDFLSEAIELYRESLQLRDPGTPKHFASLHSLATILGKRFIRTRHDDSLEEAVCLSRQVLQLCPIGSTDRGIHLYNLANLLRSNFEHLGDSRILQEAIDLLQEALLLFPSDSRYRGPLLINLATTLLLYYEEVADLEMLDEAIYLSEELMIYLPHNHPEHRLALSRLASALRHKYERSGNSDLLMRSIRLHRESLQLTPSDHPERDISLNNLSTALVRYFERVGDPDARTEAIELFQQTLELRPRSHPNRDSALSNLGVLLSTYARDKEDYQILHEAILLLRESLESRQSGHPGRSISLENLAVAFGIKFQLSGDPAALEDCIVNHREALKLRPPGHKNHISSVNNLAGALANKTENDTVFFEEAISLVRNALAITHDENPERCSLHYAMARLLLRDSLYFSWDESFQHLSLAIANPTTSARAHLSAMIEILSLLEQAITRFPDEKGYSQRTLDIYIQIINLLPRVAHFGLNLPSRLRELSTSEHLCRTAATRAFLLDRIDTAIEIIETGKAIFWAQTLRLRTSELDQLPTAEKAELSGLLQLLEQGGQNISEQPKNRAYVEQISNEQRRLNDRAEQMIDEIRLRPGFDRFLRTPSFNLLSQAAENGPVIMLIPADSGCMAVSILNSSGATKVTHLRSITPEILQNLCLRISDAGLRDGGNANTKVDDTKQPSERMAFHISQPRSTKNNFTSALVLEEIWSKIVKPVIDMLGLKKNRHRDRPRVYWCPVGDFSFVPLHAAGVYTNGITTCTSDYMVSSYVPSLSSLITARQNFTPILPQQLKAILVAERNAPGLPELEDVEREVQTVADLVASTSTTTANIALYSATVSTVLDGILEAHILHLACHGHQDTDPLRSHFSLRDGSLDIAELMKHELSNATFAFLSACETAKGDRNQPDQAVHLAASMLFCGFRSVIATMWTMGDVDGPAVAEGVYREILSRKEITLDDIPYALDAAVRRLRDSGVPASRWATFIHLGG